MPKSNYDTGFPEGVTIRNVPILDIQNGDGHVYWVDSTKPNASDGNKGNFKYPFETLKYAITRCTANKGDKIFVAAGHTETVDAASDVVFNVDGITVYFMGKGANTATFDFTTIQSASLVITASNVTLINPRFVASIDGVTGPIYIAGQNCTIVGGRYWDGTTGSTDTTRCIITADTAHGLIIDDWEYIPGNELGTQKQSVIQLSALKNVILRNIKISGNFEAGNIENIFGSLSNLYLENVVLKNTNVTPKPGIVLFANSTGQAKNVDIRIVSGTSYVSSLAKLNWDRNCIGYNSDGTGGDPIGTAHPIGIEGKIDSIQEDIGDPSSRTNHQTLEDMIGVPDAANSSLDDMIRTGFDSTAITANPDGSEMERLEYLQTALTGLVFMATCDTGMTGSTTTIVSDDLIGFGDDFFNTKYYMQVIRNDNSHGTAPETQIRIITDYDSATGTFTTNPFGSNVEEADVVLIVHESLIAVGTNSATQYYSSANVLASANGSILERLQYIQNSMIPDLSGLLYSGTCDTGMVASQTAISCSQLAGYGDDLFNNKYYMTIIKNSNSIGNPPDRETRLVTDYLSLVGGFTVNSFTANVEEGDVFLLMHESIAGIMPVDTNSAYSSVTVAGNADGNIYERLEYIQQNLIPDLGGLVYSGTCNAGMTGSTTTIQIGGLSGYGEDYFNTKYYMQVIRNANSAGNAPEREVRQITDYGSGIGTFIVTAFTTNVEENDQVIIMHESLVALGRDDNNNTFSSANVVSNPQGSVLEREQFIQSTLPYNLESRGLFYTDIRYGAGSTTQHYLTEMTGYGDDFFNNKYYMQVIRNANSAGAAPEYEVRKITDYDSAGGMFTTDAFSADVEANDMLAIIHESLIVLGRDDANNTFSSTNVISNADGSLLERSEYIQAQIGKVSESYGLFFTDSCSNAAGSQTSVKVSDIVGYGEDYFNNKYYIQVIKNANSAGAAPEGEVRLITDYATSTGTFTVNAFTANVEVGDAIAVIHESLITLGRDDANNTFDSSTVVANADGSVLEREEYIQTVANTLNTNIGDPSGDTLTTITSKLGDGTTSIKDDTDNLLTYLGDPSGDTLTSITAKLGDSANAIGTQLDTVNTNIGDPSGDTLTTITAKFGDSANTVCGQVDKIDSAALTAAPTANSLAAFIASGGTALGTELADSKSIVDALGSDGTTLSYGSGSTLGAIGTEFWVKKTLVSSAITQVGVDVTGTASGELAICEIVLKTDATGLAGGTNKQVYSDNAKGLANILVEATVNLGANQTVCIASASVSGCGTILESGKKIKMNSTVADGSGAGTVDVYIKCIRLSAGATLSAA